MANEKFYRRYNLRRDRTLLNGMENVDGFTGEAWGNLIECKQL